MQIKTTILSEEGNPLEMNRGVIVSGTIYAADNETILIDARYGKKAYTLSELISVLCLDTHAIRECVKFSGRSLKSAFRDAGGDW